MEIRFRHLSSKKLYNVTRQFTVLSFFYSHTKLCEDKRRNVCHCHRCEWFCMSCFTYRIWSFLNNMLSPTRCNKTKTGPSTMSTQHQALPLLLFVIAVLCSLNTVAYSLDCSLTANTQQGTVSYSLNNLYNSSSPFTMRDYLGRQYVFAICGSLPAPPGCPQLNYGEIGAYQIVTDSEDNIVSCLPVGNYERAKIELLYPSDAYSSIHVFTRELREGIRPVRFLLEVRCDRDVEGAEPAHLFETISNSRSLVIYTAVLYSKYACP